jgi:hypothetical protein
MPREPYSPQEAAAAAAVIWVAIDLMIDEEASGDHTAISAALARSKAAAAPEELAQG